ncbi:SMI1/KNR4 family protein [Paenibacillus silvae]|uniref:SMI1/KNR4 family protein n=1 Tax=Paenibacillus silvae TaxID=1325358 RepID=UPI002004E0B4|nr:SMI1/KNR4 family protein [Paenibacillus silvae]MCK6075296.1 SMI1/KNR4 family protein [Paenibacillus silvae]MCK6149683.1 SMI1/KNR4 family protein [Paenibacillus silvae]MCK6267981.1 SMI1/KNR4 family protein [Paenibacillus silvae]
MARVEWIQSDGPISEELIKEVEQYFGVEFPIDYKECIKEFNGGYPEPDVFNINDESDAIFSCLLSYTEEGANIITLYEITSEFLPSKIIPFARDPFGNLICFDYRSEKEPSIIFFDHEEHSHEAIFPICRTFTELIDSLYPNED